jgi:hypothetical protein
LTSSSQRMWLVVINVPNPNARHARMMFCTAG